MRPVLHEKLVRGRIRSGPAGSPDEFGYCGAFMVLGPGGQVLRIISSDAIDPMADGWEHVSISLPNRCPNWPEMCFVKDLFWDPEETVVQLHPPKSQWISNHPYCLHLWRDTTNGHALPPSIFVGVQSAGDVSGDQRRAKRLKDEAFNNYVKGRS